MAEPTVRQTGPNEIREIDPLLKEFDERIRRCERADRDRRRFARQAWRTYAGDPWPEPAREQIETKDRTPAISFNQTFPTINTVLGDQMDSRREIKIRPVDLTKHDDVIAEWVTKLVRKIFQQSNGHRAETRAILDQLIAGIGWIHVWVDLSKMPPQVMIDFVPGMQMYHDPDVTRDNFTDARYLARQTMWDKKDAKSKWPLSKEVIELRAGGAGDQPFPSRVTSSVDRHDASSATGDRHHNQVSIWEYQYRRPEAWVAFQPDPEPGSDQEGQITELSHLPREEFEKVFRAETLVEYIDAKKPQASKQATLQELAALVEKDPERYREVEAARQPANVPQIYQHYERGVYYRGVLLRGERGDSHWLEKPARIGVEGFTYIPFNGYWKTNVQEGRQECFGLVEPIQDIQLLIAKVLTQTVQMLARAAKGGGFVEAGALADEKNFLETQGQPGKWHLLKTGADARRAVVPNNNPTYPQFHNELLRLAQTAIPQTTAVTEYTTGTSTRERSNVLVSNLQARARTTLGPLYDPVESGRVVTGKLLLQFIQKWVPDWVIERILGEDAQVEGITYEMQPGPDGQKQRVPIAAAAELIKGKGVVDFDVEIDTGEPSVYEKQAILSVMGQVLQTAAEQGGPLEKLWPTMIRALPLPKGKAEEMAEALEAELDQQRALQTAEGIMAALQEMPPEELQSILEQASSLLEQQMPPQQQPGAEQEQGVVQ